MSSSFPEVAFDITFAIFKGEFPETEAILSPVSLPASDFSVSPSELREANDEILRPFSGDFP